MATSDKGALAELSPAQRRRLLAELLTAREPSAGKPAARLVHERFEEAARRSPEAEALVSGDRRLTYGDLDRAADRLSRRLRALGVGAESRVGLCVERGAETVVALLATLKAGAAYVPLDPAAPPERLRWMSEDAGLRVLVTQDRFAEGLAALDVPLLFLDREDRTGAVDPGDEPRATSTVLPANAAYVLYTSGSTGRPKGVVVEHRQLAGYVEGVIERLSLDSCGSFAMVSTFTADLGNTVLFPALVTGATLHVLPQAWTTDPVTFAEYFERHPIDCLKIVPSHLAALMSVDDPGRVLPRRCLVLGGEAAGWSLIERIEELAGPACRVFNHYGPTETTVGVLTCPLDASAGKRAGSPPLGQPLGGARVQVLDRSLRPAPQGVPGELFVGGTGLARGYLGRSGLTAERFLPDPSGTEPGARLYRTGDLAWCAADGALIFAGRTDHQVKIRGFRVELGEVEAAIRAHPLIADAAVTVQGEDGNRHLVAYTVDRSRDVGPSSEELRRFLSSRLHPAMVPAALVSLPTLPLTANGKVDRRALPAPPETVDRERPDLVAPRTAAESALAGIWTELLNLGQVGLHDDFFAAGGDSLLAIRLIARAHRAGLSLGLDEIFEHPTLEQMARAATASSGLEPEQAEETQLVLTDEQRSFVESALATGEIEDAYPLTPMQAGMLFHTLYAPEAGEYHTYTDFAARSDDIDADRLLASWRRLLERHPILRTSFAWDELDEPIQLVHRVVDLPVEIEDLRGLSTEDQQAFMRRVAEDQRVHCPFDLRRAPLLRLFLFHLGPGRWHVGVSYHHLILDGWSLAQVLRELEALDDAGARDETPELAPTRPFRDYVAWLQARDLGAAESYWRRTLRGLTAPTPIAGARVDAPPERADTVYGHARLRLSPSLTDALSHEARRHRLTRNTLIQAAWAMVLSRYSGESDVVFGQVVSGRPPTLAGVESMVGLFINSLPVRVRVDAAAPLLPWLRAIQKQQIESHRYEHTPLIQVQRWSELPPGVPLFQSVLVFTYLAGAEDEGDPTLAHTGYPLSVLIRDGAELSVEATYGTTSFDDATIERMLESFRTLLEALPGARDRRVAELPSLADAERRQLDAWNRTEVDRQLDRSVPSRIATWVRETPDALAAVAGERSWSYVDLDRASDRVASRLLEHGIAPGTPVAVLAPRDLELLAVLVGLLKAGLAYLPLDTRHPPARLDAVLSQSRAPIAVVAPELAPVIGRTSRVHEAACRVLDLEALLAPGGPSGPLPGPTTPASLAYVVFTSGSTGTPKGAMIEHRGLLNHLLAKVEELDLDRSDVVAQTASQCFDISIWQYLSVLLAGGRVEILPDDVTHDPRLLLDATDARGITVLQTVPSVLRAAIDNLATNDGRPPALDSLRWLSLTGEALPPALARDWLTLYPRIPLLNAYGPTECSDDVTHQRIERPPAADALQVPIGRPLPNTRLQVHDRRLTRVPIGAPGELCVGGAGVGRGYLGEPARTAVAFVPDPDAPFPGARLYRTGDLARWRPDGALEFLGRLDHQVKVRGYRIELEEISAALERHPAVQEAVVIARRETPDDDPHLVAYVVASPHRAPTSADLRRFLRKSLPDYMVPAAVVSLDRLPLTANGKVDRAALPAPAPGERSTEGRVPPRDELEARLTRIWSDTLRLPELGVTDNFFDLGGHSLLAVRLMALIHKDLGHELPLSTLFQGPTIEHLADVLRADHLDQAWSTLVPIHTDGTQPPFFAVHPTGGDVLCYYQLSRLLGPEQPFYGIQARGLDGRQDPLSDMVEIAASYVAAVRSVQPHGPYYLGGWSFGGLAAFEAARQLIANGEEVALLAIFDSLAPLRVDDDADAEFTADVWADWFVLLANELESVFGIPLGVDGDVFRRLPGSDQLDAFIDALHRAELIPSEGGRSLATGFWRVHEGNTRAMWDYAGRPRSFPGRLSLFRTVEGSLLGESRNRRAHDNPVYGWDRLVSGKIDVHWVPGNHNTLLQPPHVEVLADRLHHALVRARQSSDSPTSGDRQESALRIGANDAK